MALGVSVVSAMDSACVIVFTQTPASSSVSEANCTESNASSPDASKGANNFTLNVFGCSPVRSTSFTRADSTLSRSAITYLPGNMLQCNCDTLLTDLAG